MFNKIISLILLTSQCFAQTAYLATQPTREYVARGHQRLCKLYKIENEVLSLVEATTRTPSAMIKDDRTGALSTITPEFTTLSRYQVYNAENEKIINTLIPIGGDITRLIQTGNTIVDHNEYAIFALRRFNPEQLIVIPFNNCSNILFIKEFNRFYFFGVETSLMYDTELESWEEFTGFSRVISSVYENGRCWLGTNDHLTICQANEENPTTWQFIREYNFGVLNIDYASNYTVTVNLNQSVSLFQNAYLISTTDHYEFPLITINNGIVYVAGTNKLIKITDNRRNSIYVWGIPVCLTN